MPPRRAASVSLTSLAKSVDAAVKIASARNKVAVDKETILDRWEIVGRRLRDVTDINTAYKFAQDVLARTKLPAGFNADPIVTRIGRDTWVGFVERGRVSKVLPPR